MLIPSVFCRTPCSAYSSVTDLDGPAVLFYPAVRVVTDAYRLWAPSGPRTTGKALVALLGSTRAAALELVGDGCTTTELARRLDISAATASHHATILREAGLVATRRHGSSVLHTITTLGSALLNGDRPGAAAPSPMPNGDAGAAR